MSGIAAPHASISLLHTASFHLLFDLNKLLSNLLYITGCNFYMFREPYLQNIFFNF